MLVTYEDMKRLKDAPYPFETVDFFHHEIGGRSLKFINHNFPWSITEIEFNYLYNTILRNDLKRGLDLCTGIGISALSAGLAMKETTGKLVTIDAYIEEYYDNFVYGEKKILENADGWKSINYLINKFNLNNTVFAEIGWSPDDVPSIIRKHFTEPLDYVFIDGGHNEEQIIKDISCIIPYTNYNTIWLLHDCNDIAGIWTPRVKEFLKLRLNATAVIKCPTSLGCHNLALIVKL